MYTLLPFSPNYFVLAFYNQVIVFPIPLFTRKEWTVSWIVLICVCLSIHSVNPSIMKRQKNNMAGEDTNANLTTKQGQQSLKNFCQILLSTILNQLK